MEGCTVVGKKSSLNNAENFFNALQARSLLRNESKSMFIHKNNNSLYERLIIWQRFIFGSLLTYIYFPSLYEFIYFYIFL